MSSNEGDKRCCSSSASSLPQQYLRVKISACTLLLTVSSGTYVVQLEHAINLTPTATGLVVGGGIDTYKVRFSSPPATGVFSWALSVSNGDNNNTILQSKVLGEGINPASDILVKIFAGDGSTLASLSTGTYRICLTIFHD